MGTDEEKLTLSQFELASEHENINLVERDSLILDRILEVTLIRNDGTRENPADPKIRRAFLFAEERMIYLRVIIQRVMSFPFSG